LVGVWILFDCCRWSTTSRRFSLSLLVIIILVWVCVFAFSFFGGWLGR
jgi:hypothetical protein